MREIVKSLLNRRKLSIIGKVEDVIKMSDPNLYLFGAVAFVLLVTLISFRSQVASLVNEQLTRVKHNENKLLEVTTAMSAEI